MRKNCRLGGGGGDEAAIERDKGARWRRVISFTVFQGRTGGGDWKERKKKSRPVIPTNRRAIMKPRINNRETEDQHHQPMEDFGKKVGHGEGGVQGKNFDGGLTQGRKDFDGGGKGVNDRERKREKNGGTHIADGKGSRWGESLGGGAEGLRERRKNNKWESARRKGNWKEPGAKKRGQQG